MFHTHAATNKSEPEVGATPSGIVDDDHEYIVPEKGVKLPDDMRLWEKSEAYFEYLGFILALNDAVKGKPNSLNVKQKGCGCLELSLCVVNLVGMLSTLDEMIDETPPIQQPQRFGNQAFRTWYQKLNDQAFPLIQGILPEKLFRAVPEIMYYLIEGFGNATRIDYGTGHEISFLMFICCLFKIGALTESDKPAIPTKVFAKYLEVVRKLQQIYRMEPAGSHGVWSLDDYQFVPFIWGSSQLIAHPCIEPPSFLQEEVVESNAHDYLFLSCIKYINEVKSGPFAEHSNQLWGISGVVNWSKINGGLIKMYKAEVLGKFPVVQHILFGSILPLKLAKPNAGLRKMRMSLTPPPNTKIVPPMVQEEIEEIGEQSQTDSEENSLKMPPPNIIKVEQPPSDTSKSDITENESGEENNQENNQESNQ